jgi:hypothetical protein
MFGLQQVDWHSLALTGGGLLPFPISAVAYIFAVAGLSVKVTVVFSAGVLDIA